MYWRGALSLICDNPSALGLCGGASGCWEAVISVCPESFRLNRYQMVSLPITFVFKWEWRMSQGICLFQLPCWWLISAQERRPPSPQYVGDFHAYRHGCIRRDPRVDSRMFRWSHWSPAEISCIETPWTLNGAPLVRIAVRRQRVTTLFWVLAVEGGS